VESIDGAGMQRILSLMLKSLDLFPDAVIDAMMVLEAVDLQLCKIIDYLDELLLDADVLLPEKMYPNCVHPGSGNLAKKYWMLIA
jgi:hypothetical protein